ncbi:MAG: TlyA family RNA methyltransferase [Anaerolineae bacterium]
MAKFRLDTWLTEHGLAENRSRAQALIIAGKVQVDGQVVTKPGFQVTAEASVIIEQDLPYVSRGGQKLAAALDEFRINPATLVCADVGASTGGFTDVLLQRGAAKVYAVDVGYGQLAWKLRQDERVAVMERTNARYLEALPELVHLAAIDVSFISLKLILPVVQGWLDSPGIIVALIKPQFEAGRRQVGKGGVVRELSVQRQVLETILFFARERALALLGLIPSPLLGPAGNHEFLVGWGWRSPGLGLELEPAIESSLERVPAPLA